MQFFLTAKKKENGGNKAKNKNTPKNQQANKQKKQKSKINQGNPMRHYHSALIHVLTQWGPRRLLVRKKVPIPAQRTTDDGTLT